MALGSGGDAVAEDGDGPPPTGSWYVVSDTTIEGGRSTITGDIEVATGATLTLSNTSIAVNFDHPGQYAMRVWAGATLVVQNSTLRLDTFESEGTASLHFTRGSHVHSTGLFMARSRTVYAEDTTLTNTASKNGTSNNGNSAVFILDGVINGECRNVHIINEGGDAWPTSPMDDGSRGGKGVLVSNVSSWVDSTLECEAGDSQDGGLSPPGAPGGSGALGADAEVRLGASHLERTLIKARASDGGTGARGYHNPSGDGAKGGDGADGGDALVNISSRDVLQISDCTLLARSGLGGSGGHGGDSTNGTGGKAGRAGSAGDATIEVACTDDIHISRTDIKALGEAGGYGGDFGRHLGSDGEPGLPTRGEYGGQATVDISGNWNLVAEGLSIEARGGNGTDGGGGHDVGQRGGDGGYALVSVVMEGSIVARGVELLAVGGDGGNGGPAMSEIRGDGGTAGDVTIVLTGRKSMDIDRFTVLVEAGTGGSGSFNSGGGPDGFPTLDVETRLLRMSNGTLNEPLDDLSGDAVGYLYNVTFDYEGGLYVLPIDNAVVYMVTPVTIRVVDDHDLEEADPLPNHEVTIHDIETGSQVASALTDSDGKVFFDLPYYTYTSTAVKYTGSYHVIVSTPDGKHAKEVKIALPAGDIFTIPFKVPKRPPHITIDRPSPGTDAKVYPANEPYLGTFGEIEYDERLVDVRVQLLPPDEDPTEWPIYTLEYREIHNWRVLDKEARWGYYFPPGLEGNGWMFFNSFPLSGGNLRLHNDTWRFIVYVQTEYDEYLAHTDFDLVINANVGRPWVHPTTQVHNMTYYGTQVRIDGVAGDDYDLAWIEVRIDGGEWAVMEGSEEWYLILDTAAMVDGPHTIEFRASDGMQLSEVVSNTFYVDRWGQEGDGDGGEGNGRASPGVMVLVGIALLVAGMVLLAVFIRTRSGDGPDS